MTSPASPFRRFLGLLGMFVFLTSLLTALGAAWMVFGLGGGSDLRTAQGRVVGQQNVQLKRGPGARSIVEFTTHDGRSFQVTDALVRQGQAIHEVGESITVRYSAADPTQAEIGSSFWLRTVAGWVLLAASAAGMAVGGLLRRLSNPRASHKNTL
ncbi:DUF3592 domain-containing protein [Stenotrophomonas nitritireducens]|uniref:DUF3592 domain-containing protein n=1 Tax=Stenotrophomonas nitritireducens TaxID=83617 RepID=UPI003D99D871